MGGVATFHVSAVLAAQHTTNNENLLRRLPTKETATKNIKFSLLNLLRRSKVQSKEWISLSELKSFSRLPIVITGSVNERAALQLLNSRIASLVVTNGWSFAFLYLKEALRLTIRALAGQAEPLWENAIPRVRRDLHGYPTIIPLSLRFILRDYSKNIGVVRATLSVLSVFRTFKVPVKPSLDSITEPFNGISSSFDKAVLRKALKGLRLRAGFAKFRGFISESAGPNTKFATWGASIDALAFLEHPKQFLTFVRVAYETRSFGYLALFLVINIIYGPVYGSMRILGMIEPLRLGKLAVVRDQAGKARIVAITNWWIQLALKPLHESIFSSLKRLETDGTFDQGAPLLRLYQNRDPNHKFSCYDLSNATDRLPMALQVDILNALGVRGDLWSSILDFPWKLAGELRKCNRGPTSVALCEQGPTFFTDSVKYSVGQPMGAYSSWGMLAVTHHVIVQIAATRAGLLNFKHYCVLGDDIVINNDVVAKNYVDLMSTLGVSINQSKSVVSYDIVEFAKRWLTPFGEITALGPGNVLNCTRNPAALGSLLYESHSKGYIDTTGQLLNLLPTLPKYFERHVALAVNAMFGLTGCFHPHSQLDTQVLSWCAYGPLSDPMVMRYSFYNGLLEVLIKELRDNLSANSVKQEKFLKDSLRITGVRSKTLRFIELTSLLLNPGFYLYLQSFVKTEIEIKDELSFLFTSRAGSWDDIRLIAERTPRIVPATLNWGTANNRRAAKDFAIFYRKLDHAIMQTANDMYTIAGADGTYIY